MASSSPPVHPYRYLAVFLVLLIGAYALVFLTGNKQPDPKLGIDLQGGTRVTLTARTPDGSKPTRESLIQAQDIISARVNGLGVSGSEVVVDGDNLVITVPGNDSSEARNLGQTARLYIRPVIHAIPAAGQGQQHRPAAPGCARSARSAGPSRWPTWSPGRAGGLPGAPAGARVCRVRRCRSAGGAGQPATHRWHRSHARSRRSRSRAPRRRRPHRRRQCHPTRRLRRPRRTHRLRRRPRRRRRALRNQEPTWRSASPTRRRSARAPSSRFRCWPCSSRPRGATTRTSWQATTIPSFPW